MKSVLLTGGSGFLGSIIKSSLLSDNIEIKTVGRSFGDDFLFDLLDDDFKISGTFDLIIHSAGKAHSIPGTDGEKEEFFNVNVNGTIKLLQGLQQLPVLPKSFVFISSVAVYGLKQGVSVDEKRSLDASDVYGLSKVQAEQVIEQWCERNNIICTILRLPLLAGPNPPGNLRAMISGIRQNLYFNIAEGKAMKSLVLAEDVAKIIPIAAEVGGVYNLTDGYHPSFSELSEVIAAQLGKSKPVSIPNWLASIMAKAGDLLGSKVPINSDKLLKMTSDLTFDDSKARQMLGWNPTPVLKGFKIH